MKNGYSEIPYNEYLVIRRLSEEVLNQSFADYIKDALEMRTQADLDDYVTV